MSTDAELFATWRQGDREAGQALFDRHLAAIRRFFANKTPIAVDDLVQQTFLSCTESRDTYRGESSFRSWLFGIAHNVLGTHLRDNAGRTDAASESMIDGKPSPSSVYAARAEDYLLFEALRRLPMDSQVALELHFWEQMSGSEMAVVLGIPEGTVRTRLRRARTLLEEQVRALAQGPMAPESGVEALDDWARTIRERFR